MIFLSLDMMRSYTLSTTMYDVRTHSQQEPSHCKQRQSIDIELMKLKVMED